MADTAPEDQAPVQISNPIQMQAPVPVPEPAELVPKPKHVKSAKPTKQSKRYRPLGPPFHEVLYSQNGRKMRVRLDVPSAGEECPLTLGPIAEDSLDFLQSNCVWFPGFPDAKKITLPCGHGFGALNILYHFCRRNMLCPCCRAGVDSKLATHCLPASFRHPMHAKVQRELRVDSEEQVESDRTAALSVFQSESEGDALVYVMDIRFMDIIISRTVSMNVQLYSGGDEGRRQIVNISVPLVASFDANNANYVVFSLPRGRITTFVESALRDPTVHSMALTVVVDVNNTHVGIEVADAQNICIDRSSNREFHNIRATNDSNFVLELHEGGSRIHTMHWRSHASIFSNL